MRYIVSIFFISVLGLEGSALTNIKKDSTHTLQDKIPVGKVLISKSDCMTCHKENKKLVGPSFFEIAQKYKQDKNNIDYLSSKIIEGGKGVWGQVPMNAHPAISKKDADEIVKYILSIKE